MRRIVCAFLISTLFVAAPCSAIQIYITDVGHNETTEWTGVASLSENAIGRIDGELCLVRKEYASRPVFPRTLVRVPVFGERNGTRLRLEMQVVEGGPVSPAGGISLTPGETDQGETDTSLRSWRYEGPLVPAMEEDGSSEAAERERNRQASTVTQLMTLVDRPNLASELTAISFGDANRIAFYANQAEAERGNPAFFPISSYDSLSQRQVRAFESGRIFADLYTPGMALAVMESRNIGRLQATLDRLGDGARVMNAELADCPSVSMVVVVAVPEGLELWYARRLQTSDLVQSAYPEVQARDPRWSAPIAFTTGALASALRNNQLSQQQKYQAIWEAFEGVLIWFTQQRRFDRAADSRFAPLGGGPPWMYRAQITGRPLAVCGQNRWERITVQASANAFDQANGRVQISINFSDGNHAPGPSLPSDTRFDDNRISNGQLAELQSVFVGATTSRTRNQNFRCPR